MEFTKYLSRVSQKVNAQLNVIFNDWRQKIEDSAPALTNLYDLFVKQFSGGKGLRGTLVTLGFELTGRKPDEQILAVAAAFETLHTSLLIHDDIIDQSLLRRGQPSLYSALGNNHYGISQAICLGDLGLYLAIRTLSKTKFEESLKQRTITYFTDVVLKTILGEMLDIKWTRATGEKKESEILLVHTLKTAHYTIAGPLSVGAILGRAPTQTLRVILKFGTFLGLAFQIQDDILGVFGNEQVLGKPATSDIEEGKNTLLIEYAQKMGTDDQKRFLGRHYGNGQVNKQVYQKIQKIFVETGALAHSRSRAAKYALAAKKIIPTITDKEKKQILLSQLADFLIQREK